MKLVFLYGPPAVGKLTVAKKLSKLTGHKILHNQLTINCLTPVFPWGSVPMVKLNEQFRLDMIREACRIRLPGLIHTFCYGRGVDDGYIKRVVRTTENNGGKICFVQLKCEACELRRRITRSERKQHHKLTSPVQLQALLKRYDLLSPVPLYESLSIDNTRMPALRSARLIANHFHLCRKNRE